MTATPPCPPLVLVLSGHDPSGGAGVQADIEAIAANGAAAATVITALTVQDTRDVQRVEPVDPALVRAQAEAVLADMPVAAIKVGLLGSAALARDLASLLCIDVPVVLDPVLRAGGGGKLADDALGRTLLDELLPRVSLLTPNLPEARALSGESDPAGCGRALRERGAGWVLITGTHEEAERVTNRLYGPGGRTQSRAWDRLPHSYHGSGCTLASAAAALLARGLSMERAVAEAQAYTWESLARGCRPGGGQWLPRRLPARGRGGR